MAERVKNLKHLKMVRALPCMLCRLEPCGVAHHLLRADPTRGMGRKAGDNWAVPLCPSHHDQLHNDGLNSVAEDVFFMSRGWPYDRVKRYAAELWNITERGARA